MRHATADDARVIAELHVAVWCTAYRGLLPDAYLAELSVDQREVGWRDVLGAGRTVLLAESGGELAGFVCYGPSRDEGVPETVGEVYALNINPSYWGSGIGRQLHDAAVAALAADGLSEATLWVLAGNRRACRFYERQGWHDDGHLKSQELPKATLAEVRYRRSLAG